MKADAVNPAISKRFKGKTLKKLGDGIDMRTIHHHILPLTPDSSATGP